MTQDQAEAVTRELISVCNKWGLWYTVEHEHKPGLKAIRIKEISIKVENN